MRDNIRHPPSSEKHDVTVITESRVRHTAAHLACARKTSKCVSLGKHTLADRSLVNNASVVVMYLRLCHITLVNDWRGVCVDITQAPVSLWWMYFYQHLTFQTNSFLNKSQPPQIYQMSKLTSLWTLGPIKTHNRPNQDWGRERSAISCHFSHPLSNTQSYTLCFSKDQVQWDLKG